MEAFSPNSPEWIESATHAIEFCCPRCRAGSTAATAVWINRRSPVTVDGRRRKWQEFYQCECSQVWWAWSSDRPANEFADRAPVVRDDDLDFDGYYGYF
jgi:hypothetical protein